MDSGLIKSATLEPSAYTDITGLNRLKRAAVAEDPGAIKAVAKQFEALFINMMMKSMREANEVFGEDSPFNSSETKFYQDMLDKEYGLTMASAGGIGLAAIIEKLLMGRRSTDIASRPVSIYVPSSSKVDAVEGMGDEANQSIHSGVGVDIGVGVGTGVGRGGGLGTDQRDRKNDSKSVASGANLGPSTASNKPSAAAPNFESPEDFVDQLWGLAKSAAKTLSVDPRILVAQAALETGWGQFTLKDSEGGDSFNLFNIKAGSGWDGKSVLKNSLEYEQGIAIKKQSSFRAYQSFEESFNDYIELIQSSPRYQKALSLVSKPLEYINELQRAGYATDPDYGAKVARIFNSEIFK